VINSITTWWRWSKTSPAKRYGNLAKNSEIVRHEQDAGKLMIIPAVYLLVSGEVTRIG